MVNYILGMLDFIVHCDSEIYNFSAQSICENGAPILELSTHMILEGLPGSSLRTDGRQKVLTSGKVDNVAMVRRKPDPCMRNFLLNLQGK